MITHDIGPHRSMPNSAGHVLQLARRVHVRRPDGCEQGVCLRDRTGAVAGGAQQHLVPGLDETCCEEVEHELGAAEPCAGVGEP